MKAGLLQLFFVDLADVAEQVSGQRPVRIGADEDPLRLNPREAVLVLLQVVDDVFADVAAQGDRGAGGDLEFFVHRAPQPFRGAVGEGAEPGQLFAFFDRVFGQLLGADLERQAGPVADQDVAVAVEDLAARGADLGTQRVRLLFASARYLLPASTCSAQRRKKSTAEEGQREAADDGDAAAPSPGCRATARPIAGTSALLGSQHGRLPAAPHGRGSSTSAGRTRRRTPM